LKSGTFNIYHGIAVKIAFHFSDKEAVSWQQSTPKAAAVHGQTKKL